MEPDDEKLITRYLLGELSEEDQSQVEERFFADSIFFWRIEAARNELIDEYLRDALTTDHRQKFESNFLTSPGLRARVESARMLVKVTSRLSTTEAFTAPRDSRQNLLTKLLVAAAVFTILVAGAWLVRENLGLRRRLEQAESESRALQQKEESLQQKINNEQASHERMADELKREQDERARLEQELASVRAPQQSEQSSPLIASLTLNPIQERDPRRAPRVVIWPQTKLVRLNVNFDAQTYVSYHALLATAEGAQVWQRAGLKSSAKTVSLNIPANLLTENDYLLTLSGVPSQAQPEEIGKYFFRVVKK